MRLKTRYAIGEIPHNEHPLPQAARKNWLCLNGKWNLVKLNTRGESAFEGKILVPFSPETLNSGIFEGFVLGCGEKLIYTRTFIAEDTLLLGYTRLRFGAVDSDCEVFLNGKHIGGHKGGFTAFDFDVSRIIRKGNNELRVVVTDEATRNSGARGKQSDKRGGIWYTPQSGIWQTVWLESMPEKRIRDFKITPEAKTKSVTISNVGKEETEIFVYDDEREIIHKFFTDTVTIEYDFELWSPENPKLYTVQLKNAAGDEVSSYFGVRSFGKIFDNDGKQRLTLNEKTYFFNGVLDQGYWSDGMLTYPSDQAAIDELTMLREMGFNTIRKHIKIEPMRWYYHCDRLGLIVWQDFVNGGGEYSFMHIAALPFLGFHHKDSDYKYFARESESGRAEYAAMVDETLAQLYNCTSIGVWVPFNEGWGQFDSAQWTKYVKEKDSTRIIDSVSGWHDQGKDKTELKSLHIYYTPLKVPKKEKRPVVLSEFGGYSMQTIGHVFDEEKEFGYKKFKNQEELCVALEKLYLQKLLPLLEKGLSGAIYTQVSDVEEEINGLVTYDREVVKIPISFMAKINRSIRLEAERIAENF